MSLFLNLHTHQTKQAPGVVAIQSISLSESTFLAMPKTKPISIGIHPWYGKLAELSTYMKYLTVLAKQDNVKLIGECGLDKLQGEPMASQIQLLEAQMNLAEQLKKPLILHCVKAFDELIALKKKMNPSVPLIIHGFAKKKELAVQLINQGFYLSFGAAVLTSEAVAATLQQLDAPFFLETDDAQVDIEAIYTKVAELKKITVDELKDVIFANWKNIGL
ncbi:TatD family hydrolase [Nubsella zeaxanthinifaciens]|uniref:TatD family hydrolase n=1 Tax=Nubsella zeaxanthinifaciens TaxID=392412 RepID=UPI000DE30F02|nr:TatD family hydrolase [Nubsella zeaxanthinifaciens]